MVPPNLVVSEHIVKHKDSIVKARGKITHTLKVISKLFVLKKVSSKTFLSCTR